MRKVRSKKVIALTIAVSVLLSALTFAHASAENVTDSINNATESNIESTVAEYLAEAEKEAIYNSLPLCDRNEINKRILEGKPYDDYTDLDSAYQKALEYTTRADPDKYNLVFLEDFANGGDSSWTKTNVIDGAIGSGSIKGTTRQALAINDDANSFMFFGGSLSSGAANYIERDIENPNSIVTLYMKIVNNNATSFSVTFDGSNGLGLKNTGMNCHTVASNNAKADTGIDFSSGSWNKIVLDGMESGIVKCYVNGELAASFNSSITKLKVGTLFNFASFSVIAVDNISVAESKPDTGFIDDFNSKPVTPDSFSAFLSGALLDVFNKLPECDRFELISEIEKGKPYVDKENIISVYKKAIIKVTQYDSQKYGIEFLEDFADGIDPAWEGDKKPNITDNLLGIAIDNLNVSGNETNSAVFWGTSVSAGGVNGSNQSIKRSVPNDSRISLYFFDFMNDRTAFFGVKVNDKVIVGAYGSGNNYVYTTDGGKSWKETNIAKNAGWHKVVIDGIEESGKISVFIDGNEIDTISGTTEFLEIGNLWSLPGYALFALDNITAVRKFIPKAENIKIVDLETSLAAYYDYSHDAGAGEGATKFQWYRKNTDGEFEKIEGATSKTYTYNFPDDNGNTFKVEITPVDNNGIIGDTVSSPEFTESALSSAAPVVSYASILGNVCAGSEVTAEYTAAGSADAGKDKYKWFISEDGIEWIQIEKTDGKTCRLGTEIIGKKLKFQVSVAGSRGSYSNWYDSAVINDETTIMQMISAVKGKNTVGRNQEMLDFLKIFDPAYNTYSTGHQQKIVIELFKRDISTEEEYRSLIEEILTTDDTIPETEFSKVDGSIGAFVDNTGVNNGSEKERFTDLDNVEWAKDAIYALSNKNIVSGKGNQRFCPEDSITRAEFITMIIRSFFKIDYSAKSVFTDVSEADWYCAYVATAFARGIISGKGNGTFGPNDKITREEMAVICERVDALGLCDAGKEREYKRFADENDISEYAYDAVVKMYQKSFFSGVEDNRFAPNETATRAMAAKVIFVMLREDERITSNGQFTVENFEDDLGIFTSGHYEDKSISGASISSKSYSGSQGIKILGKSGVYTKVGDNRTFRIMIYDDLQKTSKTVMMMAGKYGIGVTTSSKTARLENYSYLVNNSWKDAGVTRTTGWHEFIIDMSRVGFADFYLDGMKIAEEESDNTGFEYLFIGNIWDAGKHIAYADEFRMARTLVDLYDINDEGYSNGNKLINNVKLNMENVPEEYKEQAELLNVLNILSPGKNGELSLDKKITKKEFAYFVCGMMNKSADFKSATKTYFTDVSKDDLYAGYIQCLTESGLISAESGIFGADDSVSKEYVANALMILLGYGQGMDKDSSWRLDMSNNIGLFKGVTGDENALTYGDIIKVCYNTLLADMLEVNFSEGIPKTFSKNDELTFLNYYFDIYEVDEYINGIYGTEFTGKKVLDKNEVLLGNLVVKNYNNDFCKYNGMKVRAYIYAPESDDLTLAYAYKQNRSNDKTIQAHDINSVEATALNYSDGSRIKRIIFNENLKVVYNGVYLFGYKETHLKPEIGYVRFVDSDDNGEYDIAFVMSYKAVKIKAVDAEQNLIYDEYRDETYHLEKDALITSNINNSFSIENLSNGQIILLAVSDDRSRADIIDEMEVVEGKISAIQDEYIIINDTEYTKAKVLDEYYKKSGLNGWAIGTEGEFVIDCFNNIVGSNSTAQSNRHFGYLIKVMRDDDKYFIKMYVDTGSIYTYTFSEKIKYNGSQLENPDVLLLLSPQLVRFKTRSDGAVSEIETAKTEYIGKDTLKGTDEFWLYRDESVWFRDNGYFFGLKLRVSKETPFMFVPDVDSINDEKKYRMGTYTSFGNGQTFAYKAYNADEYNFPEIILVESTSGAKLLKGNETPLFVVKNTAIGLDEDDNIVKFVHGYEAGDEKVYKESMDYKLSDLKENAGFSNDIEPGDTFIPAVNNDNEICALKYIVRMDETPQGYTDLSTWNFVFDNISCCYARIEKFGKALKITDGKNSQVIGSPERIYVYSLSGKTITSGSNYDLIPGRDISIRTTHGNTREVIVYID